MVSLKTILLKILLNNQIILIQTKPGDHMIVFSKQVEGYFSLDIQKKSENHLMEKLELN